MRNFSLDNSPSVCQAGVKSNKVVLFVGSL